MEAVDVSLSRLQSRIAADRKTWLVTGAAGFIGSHLLEQLLLLDQRVIAVDDFSTGSRLNLESVRQGVGAERYRANCKFIEGDLRDFTVCEQVCQQADYVLHQAALCSVSMSLETPLQAHETNLTASLNLMWASVQAGVSRFVYASSCAVYGDQSSLPHCETYAAQPMSPYAVGKFGTELYARNFHDCYRLNTVGLRYFNIFGPRQAVEGAYTAVIPSFARDMLDARPVQINGDGLTSRDFCFIDNVVQANLLAATTDDTDCFGKVFNVAGGEQISILELYEMIRDYFAVHCPEIEIGVPVHGDFRPGEIHHSLGDISLIADRLGYCPTPSVREALSITLDWYLENGAAR
jgi:UDP-N-acetylglucosamine 4-epimerase